MEQEITLCQKVFHINVQFHETKSFTYLRNYLFFHKKIFGIGEQLMKRAKKHICHPCKFMVKRDEKEKIEKPECIYVFDFYSNDPKIIFVEKKFTLVNL